MLDKSIFKSSKIKKPKIDFNIPKFNTNINFNLQKQTNPFKNNNFLFPKSTSNNFGGMLKATAYPRNYNNITNPFSKPITGIKPFIKNNYTGKPWHDNDRDGLINIEDCKPNNYFKQGWHNDIDSKEEEYLDIEGPEFKDRNYYSEDAETYGDTSSLSGKKAGSIVATSGLVVPVVLPIPLTSAVGGYLAKNVEKVKFIKTDEHDNKYKIPRLEFHSKGASKQKQDMWKNFSTKEKNQYREILPDRDGDRVPDEYDCQPDNVMRQDSWKFPKGVEPYNEEPTKGFTFEPYGEREAEPEIRIINQEGDPLSLQQYSQSIRGEGNQIFISTTKMNMADKLADIKQQATTVYPLNYQGLQMWQQNMRETDLEGVDTPDNEILIRRYENQMQINQNKIPQDYLSRAYQHMRDNPQIYNKVDKQEAVRNLAKAFMEGTDPIYVDQEYADMGGDISYDEYKANEQDFIDEIYN